jgi:hypothetical protein
MKKCKITFAAILLCLFAVSSAQAGPTKQKPPAAAEYSVMTEIMAFFGFTE